MSIYKKQELVASYPAYNVYKRLPSQISGAIELTSDEQLGLRKVFRGEEYFATFTIGSVASYALKNNRCPMKDVERAIENGHKLYYIFGNGACLSSSHSEPKDLVWVEYGMKVHFEGHYFVIEKAPNDNLKLVEISKEEL